MSGELYMVESKMKLAWRVRTVLNYVKDNPGTSAMVSKLRIDLGFDKEISIDNMHYYINYLKSKGKIREINGRYYPA